MLWDNGTICLLYSSGICKHLMKNWWKIRVSCRFWAGYSFESGLISGIPMSQFVEVKLGPVRVHTCKHLCIWIEGMSLYLYLYISQCQQPIFLRLPHILIGVIVYKFEIDSTHLADHLNSNLCQISNRTLEVHPQHCLSRLLPTLQSAIMEKSKQADYQWPTELSATDLPAMPYPIAVMNTRLHRRVQDTQWHSSGILESLTTNSLISK